jgi:predicted RNA-binding Zn ribbon-like protein
MARTQEPIAVDFVNTVESRWGGDALRGPVELTVWLAAREDVLGVAAPEVGLRAGEFRALRRTIAALFEAAGTSRPMPAPAVEALNGASASVLVSRRLDTADPSRPVAGWAVMAGSRTNEILAAIAASAIELLGGPDRDRLRTCPAARCGRSFLAARTAQVWCSEACGNRMRVARHHARRR